MASPKGANLNPANLVPSNFSLVVSAILPVIIFQFVGFELQNGAGEEMHNPQRDVPRSIIRSGIVTVIAYAAFLFFIILALPKGQLSSVGGFLSAFVSVGVYFLPVSLKCWAGLLRWLTYFRWLPAAERGSLARTAPTPFPRLIAPPPNS